MKCLCLIPKNRDKKGWRNQVFTLGHLTSEETQKWVEHYKINLSDYEICGGNLTAHVKAEDEPYFGGSSASLNVYFKCDKCHVNVHQYLPDKYSIEEFLTKIVEGM